MYISPLYHGRNRFHHSWMEREKGRHLSLMRQDTKSPTHARYLLFQSTHDGTSISHRILVFTFLIHFRYIKERYLKIPVMLFSSIAYFLLSFQWVISGVQITTSPIARGYRKFCRPMKIFAFLAQLALTHWHSERPKQA